MFQPTNRTFFDHPVYRYLTNFIFFILAALLLMSGSALAGPCDEPIINKIVCENSKPGNPPSEWDIVGAGDGSIQGFATDISVNTGEIIRFKIDTDATDYYLDIYRIGYYGGMGARKIDTVFPSASLPQTQPVCLYDEETKLTDCGNWTESASWEVPPDAVSGIYIAKLVRTDTSGASHIIFIVRDDAGISDLLFQTSDTTWQAYNGYGGNFIEYPDYGYPTDRAFKGSYNRPFTTRDTSGGLGDYNWFFHAEYPMMRWIEANGYDVSYSTAVDSDRRGDLILNHKIFLSVGHDEYWSGQQRDNVEAARDAGVHLAFFSGNEVYRKIRWEESIDGSGTPYRTMVCYKESNADIKIDPVSDVWTGSWRDGRFSPPADGGVPENALTGTLFGVVAAAADSLGISLNVPEANGKLRFWRNTAVANLAIGQVATLGDRVVGYEYDEDIDNGFRPAGLTQLSSTTAQAAAMVVGDNIYRGQDVYPSGTATHVMTQYRAASGALVFSAGTVQWSWGLDGEHDNGISTPDASMQQATVNLFADMGVQPGSLDAGLIPAFASTDGVAPVSVIQEPTAGASIPQGSQVTISGTAADDGGAVGAVEVSVDGGLTWHPAPGREVWTYTWVPVAAGNVTILSRAADDSGNLEESSAGVDVVVEGSVLPDGAVTIWDLTAAPSVLEDPDGTAQSQGIEVGVKFRSASDGFITGLRFYKGPNNTGTHIGNLWSLSGQLLASATFVGETASGWQYQLLSSPVAISADTTYVASYHAPVGRYSSSPSYFSGSGFANYPLRALADGEDGGNGLYRYGASAFPNQTYNSENYWVDVVFETSVEPDTTPPTVDAVSPVNGAVDVGVGTTLTVRFNEAMDPASINSTTFVLRDGANTIVPATVNYDAATATAALDPDSQLSTATTYAATITGVTDMAGNPLDSPYTWSFTTSDQVIPEGLVAAYGFEEGSGTTAADGSGNGNDGVLSSAQWTASGRFGNALAFNGTNAWVSVNDSPSLDLTTGMTVEAWVYPTILSGWRTVLMKETANGLAYTLYAHNSVPQPAAWSRIDGIDVSAAGVSALPLNAWTHLAMAYDGSVLRLYVNGTMVGSASAAGSIAVSNGSLRIGGNSVWGEYFQGRIDEVRIYNRALLQSEIQADMDTAIVELPPDETPPSVSSLLPADGAIDVSINVSTTATFDEAMESTSIDSTTFELRDQSGVLVPATVIYNAGSLSAVLTPNLPLETAASYTATVIGGSGGVRDLAGNPLSNNFSWSFSTAATQGDVTPPTTVSLSPPDGSTNISLSTTVSAVFSEPLESSTVNSSTFQLRDAFDTVVDSVVVLDSQNNTATLTPAAPLASDTIYTAKVVGGPGGITDLAGNPMAADVSWSFTSVAEGVDTTPPSIVWENPLDRSTAISTGAVVSITFDEPMDPNTVNTSTFTLTDAFGSPVPAILTLDNLSNKATLTPQSPLAVFTEYTASVIGGTNGMKDLSGNPLISGYSWAFTTSASSPLSAGPGGPILVITGEANPFSQYYAEILRAEGLNAYREQDLSAVDASVLSNYDLAILGALPLSSSQAAMFTNWVQAGGRLIGMRPDKQLAGLLGLADIGGTLAEGYLLVDTSASPGKGIVGETIQYHGQADRYAVLEADIVAELFSGAGTPTGLPAVTVRDVGTNGGKAMAFTYDLAQSIVLMRQGNPAWTGQDRDGLPPLRPNDLFYGDAAGDPQPDWVDLDKTAIPQADEQQRLLANLITAATLDIKPLPRFWYFPHRLEAVVVMTMDNHGYAGIAERFESQKAFNSPGCSVDDWECIRSSSYSYSFNSPLPAAQAQVYEAEGFEVALHITTECGNYDAGTLETFITDQYAEWRSLYPDIAPVSTNRTHCIAWSGYTTMAELSVDHGIRMDTNYYYWPESWVLNRPGFFTGSGMPMRFTTVDGDLLDIYQVATQMTDESGQSYPFTINTLLDRAIGPEQYYGAFTANIHDDGNIQSNIDSDAIIASAVARGIPVISARQLLQWVDGRNGSTFGNIAWDGAQLSFDVQAGQGANGLHAMVPVPAGYTVMSISRNANSLGYVQMPIKGVEYVIFPSGSGSYVVDMNADATPPTVVASLPADGSTEVPVNTVVSAIFSESMDAGSIDADSFELRDASGQPVPAAIGYDNVTNTASLTPNAALANLATYSVTVYGGPSGVTDVSGNPLASNYSWTFTTADSQPPDQTPPVVDSVAPADGAVDVDLNSLVTAVFNEAMDPASIGGTTFQLRDASDALVIASVAFDSQSNTATLTPNDTLAPNTTYNATLTGGAGGIADVAGNPLATDVSWSFTTVTDGGDTNPPSIISEIPADGSNDVSVNTTVSVTFSEAMDPSTIDATTFDLRDESNQSVAGILSYDDASATASLSPDEPLSALTAYTVTVYGGPSGVTDIAGNPLETDGIWMFTTADIPYSGDTFSLWGDMAVPLIDSVDDTNAVELGMKFQSEVDGYVTAIRFYKGASNIGIHTGGLWSVTGSLLAGVTFTDETPSGWQEAVLAAPVAINAGTTYVVSYHTNLGYYSADAGDFSNSAYINPPLRALTDGEQGGNGVYRYGASGFPSDSYNGTNYWVDVVFTTALEPDTSAPTISSTTPSDGATGVNVNTTVAATFSEAMDASTIDAFTFELLDGGGVPVPVSLIYDEPTMTARLTPDIPLSEDTAYTATVAGGIDGVSDAAGNPLASDVSWTFTTASQPSGGTFTLWTDANVPDVVAADDPNAVELGFKFQSDTDGFITGIRFYKSPSNTGIHVGNLWSAGGTLLATVIFTNETADGWQEALFTEPVPISANTTYVGSYHTQAGFYSYSGAYFSGADYYNAPLRALADGESGGNGVYRYGASGFPSQSWNATHYWVDVVFTQ